MIIQAFVFQLLLTILTRLLSHVKRIPFLSSICSSQSSSIHWPSSSIFPCLFFCPAISSSFSFFGRPRHPRLPRHYIIPITPIIPITAVTPIIMTRRLGGGDWGVKQIFGYKKDLLEMVWNREKIGQILFWHHQGSILQTFPEQFIPVFLVI